VHQIILLLLQKPSLTPIFLLLLTSSRFPAEGASDLILLSSNATREQIQNTSVLALVGLQNPKVVILLQR